MKHSHQYHHDQNQHPVNTPRPTAGAEPKQKGIAYGPSTGEIAKRAYQIYEHQGSQPGHDVQNWQEAEAQLVTEGNFTWNRDLPGKAQK